jgi:hypothetical protein
MAGSSDLTLTLRGSHFVEGFQSGSIVMWTVNDSTTRLGTTFVSSTQLTAVIPAALLSHPGTARVFLQTGDPEDGIPLTKSNAIQFSIQEPPQGSIYRILPTTAIVGSPDLTLTITGANFIGAPQNRTQAVWAANGSNTVLATTWVSSSLLTAVIPAALLSKVDSAQVFVEMGDLPLRASNTLIFTVSPQAEVGTGEIIVYGQPSTLPFIAKGFRDIQLDGSGWHRLYEADSVMYSHVSAGNHQLTLSNPCSGSHRPSVEAVTAVADSSVNVPVRIPANCE